MKKSEIGLAPGTIINGCRIISEIGSGGMGAVYKAHDETLDRLVAVKVMHSDTEIGKARFVREASAIAKLDHPGIVKIYSYGEFENQPFFIMEFVDGLSIRDFLTRCRSIHFGHESIQDLLNSGYIKSPDSETPFFLQDQLKNPLQNPDYPAKVRTLMLSAASALAAAHKEGIIHRDVKSSNMLIFNDERVKLLDFGLVKQKGDSDITRTDHFMGTLNYAAPEQLMGSRGKVSSRTDIYGFGVILYELLTLQHPLQEEDPAAIVATILNGEFPRPSSINSYISPELEGIILKCLQKVPEKRYADGMALYAALKGEASSSTWFSGFTEMLKGWFLKENHPIEHDAEQMAEPPEKASAANAGSAVSSREVAARYFKTARKKFFKNFAVIDAIENLKQAIEIEPGNADTLFLLSFALNAIGQSSDVRSYLDEAEKILDAANEKDHGKFLLIQAIFITRNYEDGKRRATRLHQIFPEDMDFLLALFFCYEALGHYTEAIKVGEILSQHLPDNNIIAVAQSECYFSTMDFAKAIAILRERIEQYPDYHNLRLKIIQALLISGKFTEAANEVEVALKKDSLNMLLQFYHGRILVLSHNYPEAFAAFRQAVSVPGDDGLRAMGFYCLYRLKEIMGKPDVAQKYLRQARELKKKMDFLANDEIEAIIKKEQFAGLIEEIGEVNWLQTAFDYARRICFDSADLHAFTIGNHGCTSILEINPDGRFSHHAIYSNFNLYDSEELYTQLWLSEYPQSPFIDESGNILTCRFYPIEGVISGGIASLTLAKPWEAGQVSHIYCRLSDGQIKKNKGKFEFELPELPMPACRRQAFMIIVPNECEISLLSSQPEQIVSLDNARAYCYFPYLTAGEVFNLQLSFA